ncbi:hypothetical protein [Microcella sp.]|uniref:hypothetical protein n=1 Tax=Microcella sp. TaxID=1913979 RepID=UPI003F72DB17
MKTQIITALSIVAVLGSAGGAYAINQTMLTTASSAESVIGTATPVLVPVAPKGNDIPAEYLERVAAAAAAAAKTTPLGGSLTGTSSPASPSGSGAPAPSASPSSYDDDQYEESDDDHDDEYEAEHEDESDDDD